MKMNELTCLMVMGVMVISTAWGQEQKFTHPGFACTDVVVLQAQLALADTNQRKVGITYMITNIEQPPESFAAACSAIDAAVDAVNPATIERVRREHKKQLILKLHPQWLSDLLTYCAANPSPYDLYIGLRQADSEWAWQRVGECMLLYKYPPSTALLGIEYLNSRAIVLDKPASEVLALLKKLNRTYSALLTTDQAAWETVVAQVRTLMETYE